MKKRILVTIVLVLVLALTASIFAGCDEIFKKNDYRDMHQVVASMSYKGQTKNIYKFELRDSFNMYAYIYVSYYQMSYEEAADYLLKSMAQRELLVMFAKEQVAIAKGHPSAATPEVINVEELLRNVEKDHAIKNVNDSLMASLESIVSDLIDENKKNDATQGGGTTKPEGDPSKTISVRFESMGGSSVDNVKVNNGALVPEPTEPTKTGYQFYGWTWEKDGKEVEFDFDEPLTVADGVKTITLKAKWVETTAARPELPKETDEEKEEKEKEEYDPDIQPDIPESEISPKFFDDAYRATINEEIAKADFAKEMDEAELIKYIDEGIAKLKDNLAKSYKEYDYLLSKEYDTALVERLELVLGESATIDQAEIQAEFDRLVAANKEVFAGDSDAYQSALASALATTYYHEQPGFGYVNNILLKLDQKSVDELTQLYNDGVAKEYIEQRRDELLQEMTIKISNPLYQAEFEADYGKDENGDPIVVRDPMTDPNNKYNYADGYEEKDRFTKEDLNKILSLEKVDGKWQIKYNVTAYASMPYIYDLNNEHNGEYLKIYEHPAFTSGDVVGIVDQVYNSFKEIDDNAELSAIEKLYWKNEMAKTWTYIIGDDTGSTNSQSNNNGLGYLVNPEKDENQFIEKFTDQALNLIEKGAGSYSTSEDVTGSYIFADSFIESGNTQSAYAGIFILYVSCVPYDMNNEVFVKNDDGEIVTTKLDDSKILPLNYIIQLGETPEDCKTIQEILEETMLKARKDEKYESETNKFGVEYFKNVQYNKKAYESLWKNQ